MECVKGKATGQQGGRLVSVISHCWPLGISEIGVMVKEKHLTGENEPFGKMWGCLIQKTDKKSGGREWGCNDGRERLLRAASERTFKLFEAERKENEVVIVEVQLDTAGGWCDDDDKYFKDYKEYNIKLSYCLQIIQINFAFIFTLFSPQNALPGGAWDGKQTSEFTSWIHSKSCQYQKWGGRSQIPSF